MNVACVINGFIRNINNIKNISVFFYNINNEKLNKLTIFYIINNITIINYIIINI